jgi:S-DNA-T family DNA segregation ATPase FtsK/SpoIIIE
LRTCSACHHFNPDQANNCTQCSQPVNSWEHLLGGITTEPKGSCSWDEPVIGMLSLVDYLEESFSIPLANAIKEVALEFANAQCAAQEKLDERLSVFRMGKETIDREIAKLVAEITQFRATNEKMIAEAQHKSAQIQQQMLAVRSDSLSLLSKRKNFFTPPSAELERSAKVRAENESLDETYVLQKAELNAANAIKLAKQLNEKKTPAYPAIALVPSFLAALVFGNPVTSMNVFFFTFVVVYLAIVLIGYFFSGRSFGMLFQDTLVEIYMAEICAAAHSAGVRKNKSRAIANATKSFSEAKATLEAQIADLDRRVRVTALTQNATAISRATAQRDADLQICAEEFRLVLVDRHKLVERFNTELHSIGSDWESDEWHTWTPPQQSAEAVRIGTLSLTLNPVPTSTPDYAAPFRFPALLPLCWGQSLLIASEGEGRSKALEFARALMLRLLATFPPGKLRFVLIDPVGLGQNVASFMELADHDKDLIASKSWSEAAQIERQLTELTSHIETVIQTYLRNDYATIQDYNRKAGEVAEAFRVLMVFDFPSNFSDSAAQRLLSISQNGPRCGVFPIILHSSSKPMPYGFKLEDLIQCCTSVDITIKGTAIKVPENSLVNIFRKRAGGQTHAAHVSGQSLGGYFKQYQLDVDPEPTEALKKLVISTIGVGAKAGSKVEVPFKQLLKMAELSESEWWTTSSALKLEVPLGPKGTRTVQSLTFGEGTAHHGLIVGRTGSGKSNLMHVIITTLALKYSPSEVQLYLIDFKQGVEFKCYAASKLPHALTIAIESEREFGLSVLRRLQAEMQARGEKFRNAHCTGIAEFRGKTGHVLPRILLIVDEFQEFFSEDDSLSIEATSILDQLVRQARYSGIHVLLGSQTLTSGSLPASTLGQIGIRIALQCSESDARLLMADGNLAARRLSRPGEALYNSQNGLIEGNELFQVALFSEQDRESYVASVVRYARTRLQELPEPVVFEGNMPAPLDTQAICAQYSKKCDLPHSCALLGSPIEIKDVTEVRFRKQSGSNLLMVMRDEVTAMSLISSSVISLHSQRPLARFFIADFAMPDMEWSDLPEVMAKASSRIIHFNHRRDLMTQLKEFANWVREPLPASPEMYLVIFGLHRARDLRDDFNSYGAAEQDTPMQLFNEVLREGPEIGIHVIVWCDSMVNFGRLNRSAIREFSFRVAGPMSSSDSSQLIGEENAARLRDHYRALLYDEERPGVLEKFRPYLLPTAAQLRNVLTARASTIHA